jgi:hypothetical protein
MEEGRGPSYVSHDLGEVQDRLHKLQGGCSSDGEGKEGSGGDREVWAEAIHQASRTARHRQATWFSWPAEC